jgi:NTP pyrophosphatase (non-canonical NTP hydrolase)
MSYAEACFNEGYEQGLARGRTERLGAALEAVMTERSRQDAKWGEQNHDPFTYLTILAEEFGELAQAALHLRFGGRAADGLRMEAVHTAAVALAIIECLDRGAWQWGSNSGATQ